MGYKRISICGLSPAHARVRYVSVIELLRYRARDRIINIIPL